MFLQQVSIEYILWSIKILCIRIAVSGQTSGVTATFVSVAENTPKANQHSVQIRSIVNNGATYLFQVGETLNGVTSGVTATIIAVEYNNFVRNEDD